MRSDNDWRYVLWGALTVALLVVGFGIRNAYAEPPSNSTEVIRDSLGSITNSDGWCEPLSTTPENLWDSAPARLTTVIQGEIRFVTITNIDSTINACAVGGDNANFFSAGAFDCAGGANTAGRIAAGAFKQFQVRRTRQVGPVTGATIDLWAVAESGTPSVCVDVGW